MCVCVCACILVWGEGNGYNEMNGLELCSVPASIQVKRFKFIMSSCMGWQNDGGEGKKAACVGGDKK